MNVVSGAQYQTVGFDALPKWDEDDCADALRVFLSTRDLIRGDLREDCAPPRKNQDPREFFETNFQPVIVEPSAKTHFTGYYEPIVDGARECGGLYQTPLYRTPPDLDATRPYLTRAQIAQGALLGRGLELIWLADPVAAFFMQVQGCGCVRLSTGEQIRLGFAAKNGHEYRSIRAEMIRRGLLSESRQDKEAIMDWLRDHPQQRQEVMNHNKSYIFFKTLDLSQSDGPIGAMGRPVHGGRSLAVDPNYNPLGLPIYIDKAGPDPMGRLMIAQDIGSAIVGPQRGDIFFGTGADAGRIAGRTNTTGRMYLFLPKATCAKGQK